MYRYLICKPLVVYRFDCTALYHSKTRHHVINIITDISLEMALFVNCENCNKLCHFDEQEIL